MKLVVDKSSQKNNYTKLDQIALNRKEIGRKYQEDTLLFFLNNKLLFSIKTVPDNKIALHLNEAEIGENSLEVKIKSPDSISIFKYNFKVFPEDKPGELQYLILEEYNHDPKDYTQGIIMKNDTIIESTGGYGSSVLKKYNYLTGEIYAEYRLPNEYFGEGVTIFDGKLYLLTYKENRMLIFNANDLSLLSEAPFFSEGWGITNNKHNLIISDGTHKLYFVDPKTQEIIRTLNVYDDKGEVNYLNELEYINDEIYANIWFKDEIIIIDPLSGIVTKKLDLKDLVKNYKQGILSEKVLNGIAYDADIDQMIITGKRWPVLLNIKILEDNTNNIFEP